MTTFDIDVHFLVEVPNDRTEPLDKEFAFDLATAVMGDGEIQLVSHEIAATHPGIDVPAGTRYRWDWRSSGEDAEKVEYDWYAPEPPELYAVTGP